MIIKESFTIWVWFKDKERYILLPFNLDTYDEAIDCLEKQKRECGHLHKHLDYDKFQIKKRTITYSDFEVLYG